ncbi:MAG TPA: hypothetical protein VFK38_04455 [Candidatus Limnocylindrales bacterium]|nr:hypothetical protein [Candidatus Limnocylindrales bacterium]
MDRTTRRRLARPPFVAALLALSLVTGSLPAKAVALSAASLSATPARAHDLREMPELPTPRAARPGLPDDLRLLPGRPVVDPLAEIAARREAAAQALAEAKAAAARAAAQKAARAAAATASRTAAAPAPSYRGRNHFWFPALRIDQSVYSFPCSRSRAPDNLVYRWGCAGANNVYLMAHSYGKFRPLASAYYRGALRKGMLVAYADPSGRTRTYRLAWWKTARPTTAASWAWAAQSVSSLTLQTCVGANSEYRLFVRFTEISRP